MQCRCCPRFLSLEAVLWITGQGIKEYPALVILQLGLLHALKSCSLQLYPMLVSLARDAMFEKALQAKLSCSSLSTRVGLDTQKLEMVFNVLPKCTTDILILCLSQYVTSSFSVINQKENKKGERHLC